MALNSEQSAKLVLSSAFVYSILYLSDDIYNELVETPKFKCGVKYNLNKLLKSTEEFLSYVDKSYKASELPDGAVELADYGLTLLDEFKIDTREDKLRLLLYLGLWVATLFKSDDIYKQYLFYNHYSQMINSINELVKLLRVSIDDMERLEFNNVITRLNNDNKNIFSLIKVEIPIELQ